MNRTQKIAWYFLLVSILSIVMLGYMSFTPLAYDGSLGQGFRVFSFIVWVIILAGGFWVKHKQSKSEVPEDERDMFFKRRATLFSLVMVLIVIGVLLAYITLWYGPNVMVPIEIINFASLVFFMFGALFYSAALLFQYGKLERGAK